MRTQLRPDEIGFYRENGFLSVPDFLGGTDLERWRDAVDEATEERTTRLPEGELQGREPRPLDTPGAVFVQKLNLWKTNEKVRKLLFQPALCRLIAELAGVDGIRIWHDQALIKERYAAPTSFHRDNPIWSYDSPDAISLWIALDDATKENGCLCYIPGSHKLHDWTLPGGTGGRIDGLFESFPQWRDVTPVSCPVPAGGAVFHNGLTAHGAGANMTPGRRRAMTCGYMPDGSVFNGKQNIIPNEVFAELEVGDPLNDDSRNPLVWSTTKETAAV